MNPNRSKSYGQQTTTRSGGTRDNRSNGVSYQRFEQQRRQSAEEAEARKLAREKQQEAAADAWHEKNIVAMRKHRRFFDVMLTKSVEDIDVATGKKIRRKEQVVESVLATDGSEALMLGYRRQPGFDKAFLVTLQ
jgi:hypothetical protein